MRPNRVRSDISLPSLEYEALPMAASVNRLCGDDWQDWANRILLLHYSPLEYQQIPDHDRGDAGLEGFTRTAGHAFQAYGCEEPISTADRYEKQRNKMTRDIRKFIDNSATLNRIFGTVKITRWALFVPFCDSKDLIAHAVTKTNEVIAANLPYVHNTFHVHVCQQSDFLIEDRQLVSTAQNQLLVSAEPRTPEQIKAWLEKHSEPSEVLKGKLRRLPTLKSETERQKFHTSVLDWYLTGLEILELLRTYPDTYQKVKQAKTQRERFLASNMISGAAPYEQFTNSLKELQAAFAREVGELHPNSSESLAFEAVADWLLRCPLDFPEVANA